VANDPYKYFRIEARELCEQLSAGALELEKGTGGEALVSRLLRLAHTLKGAARVVKQREIADLAHGIEDALEPFRQGEPLSSRAPIDLVLAKLDAVNALLSVLDEPQKAKAPEQAVTTASAEGSRQVKAPNEEIVRTMRADISEVDALMDGIAEAHVSLSSLGRNLGGFERVDHVIELLSEQLGMLRSEPVAFATTTRSLSILEELRNLLSTLRANLSVSVEQTDRELRQARAGAELLRLVPASALFNVLERTARDAAQSLGKKVRFETRGGDVRLDGHVISVMQNALVQAVRNAVAHGIELPADRKAASKTEEGAITVDVTRHGGKITFTCRDDGRGVDIEAVRQLARRKADDAVEHGKLDDEAVLALLMHGGISTSSAVTEVSGRGVGLDVVRESVGRLGGEVAMRTASGQGTTIEISVAASLTSFDALFVEADRHTALLPLDVVRKTMRVSAAEVTRTGDGESINLDGKVIPFTSLSRSLRRTSEDAQARAMWTTIVVESRGSLAAVGVDRLLGTENVVLRALPRLVPAAPIIAGTSLDAEGTPQLVLDPAALVASAKQRRSYVVAEGRTRLPILVVDDSLTTRMLEQSILESAGYEVDVASSGEEGLEKARKRRYGLLLVDVEMPGMDGFEVIKEVRADALLKTMPAILVTSRNSPQDFQRGKEVGANAHIVKGNFDQTDFLKRIQILME
jgi:two-component system chemotaxis sensor kinase CheA